MVAALYLMQLALLCVLITNEAFTEIAWLAPLPVVTFLGSLVITRSYHDAAAQLPLAVAMESDEINRAYGETYSFLNHSYIQPALQPLKKAAAAAAAPAPAPVSAPATLAAQQQQRGRGAAREEDEEDDPFSTYVPPRAPAPAPAAASAAAAASTVAAAAPSGSGDGARESETKQMEEGARLGAAVDVEAR